MTTLGSRINRFLKDYAHAVVGVPRREVYDNSEKAELRGFVDAMNAPGFLERFNALVSDLLEHDTNTVVRMLSRVYFAYHSRSRWIDLFTETEKADLRKRYEEFDTLVLPLPPDRAYYQGLVGSAPLDPVVYWDCHHLASLHSPERFLEKDLVDAGACRGDSALVLSRLTKRKVYSFEPSRENANYIADTLAFNKVDNVVIEHCALGNQARSVGVVYQGVSGGSTIISSDADMRNLETVEMITLDSYTQEHNLDVGLIKMDVEGSEQALLRGARSTIQASKPTLIVSLYHSADDFFSIKPMLESWNLGYRFRIVKPTNTSLINETTLIAEI